MKNIADVNSDDILLELNNLDYVEDDLKLLDDEDIRPINNKQDDDLSDFYLDYETPKKEENNKVDLYTEKKLETKEEQKTVVVDAKQQDNIKPANIDNYLNRSNSNNNKNIESKSIISNSYNQPIVSTPKKEINTIITNNTPNNIVNQPNKNIHHDSNNKVELKDLNQLFNKVSNNVKGASEIVNRNAEIKRKIEVKFEELRRLQEEHEINKKKDYEEINKYKDEVYAKLQQKKNDIEKDLVDLRNNQDKFNNERKDFENYKNTTMANLKKLENDLKSSYDAHNKNIEQVELGLVKRKEQLDNERILLTKEREQLEKDREELADKMMQFNKLVDDFTNGIDNFS